MPVPDSFHCPTWVIEVSICKTEVFFHFCHLRLKLDHFCLIKDCSYQFLIESEYLHIAASKQYKMQICFWERCTIGRLIHMVTCSFIHSPRCSKLYFICINQVLVVQFTLNVSVTSCQATLKTNFFGDYPEVNQLMIWNHAYATIYLFWVKILSWCIRPTFTGS